MIKMIMYFNLRNGVGEEDFVSKAKEFLGYLEDKIEGLGSAKLYRHYMIGANPRRYQLHMEMRELGAWDRFAAFIKKDAKGARFYQEWQKLVDMDTHYDEFVTEIPL
jgi:hypothetical protein